MGSWVGELCSGPGLGLGLCHESRQTRTWDPQTAGFEEEEEEAGSLVCKWGRPLCRGRAAHGGLIRWAPRWMPKWFCAARSFLFTPVFRAYLSQFACIVATVTVTHLHRSN